MAEPSKSKLNAYINTLLADEFRKVAKLSYGQIGLCLSAAMLQFLETAPDDQIEYIKRVFEAEEEGAMEKVIEEAKRKAPKRRDRGEKRT